MQKEQCMEYCIGYKITSLQNRQSNITMHVWYMFKYKTTIKTKTYFVMGLKRTVALW